MYNLTEEQLKRLHTAMCDDNEHQCNRLNNYIHTDEYLTAEVVQVVREIVAGATEALREKKTQLEELLAEQYPDLKQSLEWADQRENELVEENRRLREQIEKMKADVCGNIRWANMNKNDQMYCKLNAMLNQWGAADD